MKQDNILNLARRCYHDLDDESTPHDVLYRIRELFRMYWFRNIHFALPTNGTQTFISNQKFMEILHALLENEKSISIQYKNKTKLKRIRLKVFEDKCHVEIIEKSIILLPCAFCAWLS